MALFDQLGNPVSTARMTARASRDAGAFRGSLSGWRGPQVLSREGESRERGVMQRRAADLAANDWAAHRRRSRFGQRHRDGPCPDGEHPLRERPRTRQTDGMGLCALDVRGRRSRAMPLRRPPESRRPHHVGHGRDAASGCHVRGGGVRTAGARAGYGRPEDYYLATPKASPARGAERAAGDG